MFGRPPCIFDLPSRNAFDTGPYPYFLRSKLAQLQDIVKPNVAQANNRQKLYNDRSTQPHQFHVGDHVWLSIPTAGKLDPQWEGQWEIQSVKGPATYKISDGTRTRVVHVNRLQHRYQPQNTTAPPVQSCPGQWEPPSVSLEEIMTDCHLPRTAASSTSAGEPRYPQRIR